MPAPTNGEIKIMLTSLTKTVETGFQGIHERQDKTNGNVTRNTDFRNKVTGALILLGSFDIALIVKILID